MDDPRLTVEQLLLATNHHDIDAVVACFAEDYKNETRHQRLERSGRSGRRSVSPGAPVRLLSQQWLEAAGVPLGLTSMAPRPRD